MRRKVRDVPTRIWTYGCQAPTENAALFSEQLLRAHRYYNALIEVERKRRDEFRLGRAAIADIAPLEQKSAELAQAIDVERTKLKSLRSAERKRVRAPELEATIRGLVAERRAVYAELKVARAALKADPRLEQVKEETTDRARVSVRGARAAAGVYWGTYLLVEKAVEAARASPLDPRFHRWQGEGRVGVQLHHEKMADVLEGRSSMLRIHLKKNAGTSRRSQKRLFGVVEIRVGSAEDRSPIFVTLPVLVHRLPPPGATLSWAWVRVTRIGTSRRYELQLSVESEAFSVVPEGEGLAAIDLGWRLMPSGNLRVGYLVDERGHEESLELPKELVGALRFSDQLRSYQSQHFNAARDTWLGYLTEYEARLPEWLAEVKKLLPHWRSPARLSKTVSSWIAERPADDYDLGPEAIAGLWDKWRVERIAEKKDLFGSLAEVNAWLTASRADASATGLVRFYMELWRRKNQHLYDWAEHQRQKALARRKDIYRCFAHKLACAYARVVFEDMDLRDLARNAKPEDDTLDHLHYLRNVAAPGELRSLVTAALGKDRVGGFPTADSTRQCADCGHVNTWAEKERAELVLTCAGCSRSWDQDRNAARVGLAREQRGGEPPTDPKTPEKGAPAVEAKPHRSKTARQVREDAAP